MIDYQIQPNTRRCAVSQRALLPGEKVSSVLMVEEGKLVRRDYALERWQGPPAGAIGFWMNRVAAPDAKKKPAVNDELLLEFFTQLEGQTEAAKVSFRYILALLLMRRRRLRFEESATEGETEVMVVRCTGTGESYRVINPNLGASELESVQDDVFRALGWE
jgi:hypothetical protein